MAFYAVRPVLQYDESSAHSKVTIKYFELFGLTEGPVTLSDVPELLSWAFTLPDRSSLFVEHLDRCAVYIVKQLMLDGVECVDIDEQQNLAARRFFVVMEGNVFKSIGIQHGPYARVTLGDFKLKFGQDLADDTIGLLLQACREHDLDRWTFAADGLNRWKKARYGSYRFNDRIFREDFPLLDPEAQDLCECVKGNFAKGFNWCERAYDERKDVYVYDMKNAYPSRLLDRVPVGPARYFRPNEPIPDSYYKLYTLSLDVEPREGFYDYLPKHKGILTVPEGLYEMLPRFYHLYNAEVLRVTAFKTRRNVFIRTDRSGRLRGFLAPLFDTDTPKCLRKLLKLQSNALIGRFGSTSDYEYTKLQLVDGSLVAYRHKAHREPLYLPLHLFVVCELRAQMIDLLQRNRPHVFMTITDSLISDQPLPDINRGITTGLRLGPWVRQTGVGRFHLDKHYTDWRGGLNKFMLRDEDGKLLVKAAGLSLEQTPDPADFDRDDWAGVAYTTDLTTCTVWRDITSYTFSTH